MSAVKEQPVIWEPTPKQAEFLSAPEREVLYGGSLGGGKTDCLLACGLSQINNRMLEPKIERVKKSWSKIGAEIIK
jgi:hypothetical protein